MGAPGALGCWPLETYAILISSIINLRSQSNQLVALSSRIQLQLCKHFKISCNVYLRVADDLYLLSHLSVISDIRSLSVNKEEVTTN